MTSINAQIRMPSKMASDNGEEVTSKYTPVKESAWDSFKGFWMTHHNLRRHPFAPPGEPKRSTWKTRVARSCASFKEFFMVNHNLRRHPFDAKM